ncbi:MAG TPA: flagella basal body P-ring formation protein FlgA [Sphingobium sp.]
MRNSIITWTLVIAGHWIAVSANSPANAQGFQNLDQIDSLVSTTVGANIGEPGGPLAPVDRRLRLAACPQMPSIEGPVFGAAIVRCDKLGWRIRVPLKLDRPAPVAASAYGRPPVAEAAPRSILIKKGDPVQLVAGNAAFSVSRAMIADEDGAVGEMISVRESRSSPAVSGRIEPNGLVRVPGI